MNIEAQSLFVFRGKGAKDRYILLSKQLNQPLQKQILLVKKIHENDLNNGNCFTSKIQISIKRFELAVPISIYLLTDFERQH